MFYGDGRKFASFIFIEKDTNHFIVSFDGGVLSISNDVVETDYRLEK